MQIIEEGLGWSWVKKMIVMGIYEIFRWSCVVISLRQYFGFRRMLFVGYLDQGVINIQIVIEIIRGFVIYVEFLG